MTDEMKMKWAHSFLCNSIETVSFWKLRVWSYIVCTDHVHHQLNLMNITKIEKYTITLMINHEYHLMFSYVFTRVPTVHYVKYVIICSLCIMVMQNFFSLHSAYHHYVQLMSPKVGWTPSVFRSWGFLYIAIDVHNNEWAHFVFTTSLFVIYLSYVSSVI